MNPVIPIDERGRVGTRTQSAVVPASRDPGERVVANWNPMNGRIVLRGHSGLDRRFVVRQFLAARPRRIVRIIDRENPENEYRRRR